MHTHTFLAEQVDQQRRRPVFFLWLEDFLAVFVLAHAVDVLVKQVSRVKRAALGFRVELCREDRPGRVDHAFVAGVVQVDKVLLPVGRQSRGVHSITVILRRDVAFASGQVESWNVVCAVLVAMSEAAKQ